MTTDRGHVCLWGIFVNQLTDYTVPIAIAAVAQLIFGVFFYGVLVLKPFQRSMCVEKGVKTYDAIKVRYGNIVCTIMAIINDAFRAIAILVTLRVTGVEGTLYMYLQAALVVSAVELSRLQGAMWQQHPLALVLIDGVSHILYALVAAAALFYAQQW